MSSRTFAGSIAKTSRRVGSLLVDRTIILHGKFSSALRLFIICILTSNDCNYNPSSSMKSDLQSLSYKRYTFSRARVRAT